MGDIKLKDIAEAAGVSVDTVSRALTGKTKGRWASAAAKVERIQELAKRMNYRPNRAAQMMRSRQTLHVGVIVHELYNPQTGRILEMAGKELSRLGYSLLLGRIEGEPIEIETGLEEFSHNLLDGVINFHPMIDDGMLRKHLPNLPAVTYNRDAPRAFSVLDRKLGAQMVLQYLWDLGHRRIAMVVGPELRHDRDREHGYEHFYTSSPVKPDPQWTIRTGWTFESGENAVDPFLETGCTACLGGNDLITSALCTGLRMRGYEVPRDFSLVSMGDDTILAKINRPQLTSLNPPFQEMIRRTVDGLIAMIEKKTPPAFRVVTPDLIVRESAGVAPR